MSIGLTSVGLALQPVVRDGCNGLVGAKGGPAALNFSRSTHTRGLNRLRTSAAVLARLAAPSSTRRLRCAGVALCTSAV